MGACRTGFGDEVIGAQRGLNQRGEGPQYPVGVEADDRVDAGGDGGRGGLRVPVPVRPGGLEQRLEQGHQPSRDARVLAEHRCDVTLAVGKPGLTQIFGVAAQHHHLLPGQPGAQHQLVEVVGLGSTRPDRGDSFGETPFCVVLFAAGLRNLDGGVR